MVWAPPLLVERGGHPYVVLHKFHWHRRQSLLITLRCFSVFPVSPRGGSAVSNISKIVVPILLTVHLSESVVMNLEYKIFNNHAFYFQ